MRKSLLIATCFGLSFLGAPNAASAEVPVKMRMTYEVYFAGLHLFTSSAAYAVDKDTYRLDAVGQTEGIVTYLFDWKGRTLSTGELVDGLVVPKQHESVGDINGERRSATLTYNSVGEITGFQVSPPPDADEVTDLPEDAEVGAIDPLSVLTELSRQFENSGKCDGSYAVFDGRRRYDLTVSSEGERPLSQTGYGIFNGTAFTCRIDFQMLGGERKEKSEIAQSARDQFVFVARPLPNLPAIPVGMRIDTDLGPIVAHLTDVSSE